VITLKRVTLRSRNTEPACDYQSTDRSGVLWDVCMMGIIA